MNMMSHWVSMGHYTGYVWSAYAMTVSVFLMNILILRRYRRCVKNRLHQLHKRDDA